MTDTSAIQRYRATQPHAFTQHTGPLVEESYWGFSVRSTTQAPLSFYVNQGLSLSLGAGFVAAVVGLLIVPSAVIQSDSMTMRLGLGVFFAILAWVLISYANRGVTSELQIDCNLCEVREVLKNRISKSTLVGQYGFDSFNAVSISRRGNDPQNVELFLTSKDPSQHLMVARGTEAQIGALYGRMTRDMMLDAPRSLPAVAPKMTR